MLTKTQYLIKLTQMCKCAFTKYLYLCDQMRTRTHTHLCTNTHAKMHYPACLKVIQELSLVGTNAFCPLTTWLITPFLAAHPCPGCSIDYVLPPGISFCPPAFKRGGRGLPW